MKKLSLILALGLMASLIFTGGAQAAAPDIVRDLQCSSGIELGSVWLTWTVPTGTDDGYEVKYIQGNMMLWDSATTYSQNWLSGAPGTKKQELVRGLNPGTEFSFAMKAKNGDGSSPVGNYITCIVSGIPASSIDSLPPSSQITAPIANSTIKAGTAFVIKGVSRDNGSSSVQKIELSFDGGYGWSQAKSVSNIDGNLYWEFTWDSPQVSTAKILVRAYDWLNNVETPVELPIIVSSTVIEPVTPPPTTTPTVPPAEVPTIGSAAQINAIQSQINIVQGQIRDLQVQLIGLLQQLLNVLLANR